MKLGGIDFPSALMTALRDHRLVVFAGAGVSMGKPASLPDFRTLAKQIAQDTGEDIAEGEPEDRFLGRLQTDRGVQVHARAAALLAQSCPRATDLHCDLLRLFPVTTSTRIVTTNFDLLFEQAAKEGTADSKLEVFRAPALPLGREFDGIVHVHGALDRPDTTVLTDADFGRAYLTEGWARRFLLDLFQSFTVLFVGYSYDDIVMHYLARALPVGDTQRFVLTDKFGDGRWTRLGVVPIPFPNYGTLYSGIRELAKYRSRRILGWQHEIREIANSDPPTGTYETETLADAFSDPARTRFFTTSARDPAWIDWLDRHRRLINLFRGQDSLTEPERELASWLAKAFAWNHPDELWRIIGRYRIHLHPEFWRLLACEVGLRGSNATDAKTVLSRWVSVLLATASPASDREFQYLAERCIKHGDVDSLIAIFEYVTTVTLRFSRFFTGLHGDAESSSVPTVLAELDVANDDYRHTAAYVWKNGLQPKLGQIAGRLLAYVVSNLETQHRTLSTWGATSRNSDPLSRSRFAIEPVKQALHAHSPETSEILIDAARDCLEWLASSEPVDAAHWCDQLASAPAPILRRLAIHGVVARDLRPDDMIDWILRHTSQYDDSARHERIRALKISYPLASQDRRRNVVRDILDYRWPRSQDKVCHELTTSHKFSWLEWLQEAAPKCRLLRDALSRLRQKYPGFRRREFPDVDHRTWLDDQIRFFPWSPQELLAHPAHEWTDRLLKYQPSDPLQPDRRRLLEAVSQASAQNIDWAMDLADDLLQREYWDADLWSVMLRTWSATKLDSSQYRGILQILARKALHSNHAGLIAGVLQALTRNTDLTEFEELIELADTVALDLWKSIDRQETPEDSDDWLIKSWTHPAGILTQFWIDSLAIWKKRKVHRAVHFERYKERFSAIVRDGTAVGRLGRCILSRNLSIFLTSEEGWTKDNLLPLFYDYPRRSNKADYLAVWDGLLSGTIAAPEAQIMKIPFLDATERMAKEPADSTRRKRFVECYTFMLTFFAGDPVRTWIPLLLKWVSDEERITFVRGIHERLENKNEVQQADLWQRWIERYWRNRVQGIPDGLQPREAWHMLRWLPLLRKVFPDAVDVALCAAPNDMDPEVGRNMVFTLSQSDLPASYPIHVAKLLIYLGNCENYNSWYAGRELVDRLLQHDLPDGLKTGLEELVAQVKLQ